MARTAKALIALAVAELGYHEKASNSQLDSKTANSGSGNWTKYARDLAAAGYYNGNKNGYAWCDCFVDWLFYMLCGKDARAAQAMECQTGDLGAACPYSAGYFKAQGRYYTSPKAGDQVFFKQNGEIVHTGIVEYVTSTTVGTIEGNSSDQVIRHTYSLGSSYIAGYGRPKYDADGSSDSSGTVTPSGATCTVKLAYLAASGYTNPAALVKTLQRLLNALGYKGKDGKVLSIDGAFGTNTAYAVKAYQTANKLTADGIVGAATWKALLGAPAATASGTYAVVTLNYLAASGYTNPAAAVKALQRLLNALGYKGKDGKALSIDGAFGTNTAYAVKAYQTANKLTADGIVGALTWKALLGGN